MERVKANPHGVLYLIKGHRPWKGSSPSTSALGKGVGDVISPNLTALTLYNQQAVKMLTHIARVPQT